MYGVLDALDDSLASMDYAIDQGNQCIEWGNVIIPKSDGPRQEMQLPQNVLGSMRGELFCLKIARVLGESSIGKDSASPSRTSPKI